MEVIGSNYPPPQWRTTLAQFLFIFKFALIAVVVTGTNISFEWAPAYVQRAFEWALNNRGYSCALTFFLIGMIENACLATGAFEVFLNDQQVYSKLQTGRLPNLNELVQGISSASM